MFDWFKTYLLVLCITLTVLIIIICAVVILNAIIQSFSAPILGYFLVALVIFGIPAFVATLDKNKRWWD